MIADPVAVGDKEPHGFIWTTWLAGDALASSVWDIPAELAEYTADGYTGTVSTIYLDFAGATANESYDITNTITTVGGRKKTLTMTIPVV